MEDKVVKPTTIALTLEIGESKCTNTHPFYVPIEGVMYELLNSFIGACTSVGFHPDTVNSVIKEYSETIEDND